MADNDLRALYELGEQDVLTDLFDVAPQASLEAARRVALTPSTTATPHAGTVVQSIGGICGNCFTEIRATFDHETGGLFPFFHTATGLGACKP